MKKAKTADIVNIDVLIDETDILSHASFFDPNTKETLAIKKKIKSVTGDLIELNNALSSIKDDIERLTLEQHVLENNLASMPGVDVKHTNTVIDGIKKLPWVFSFRVQDGNAYIVTKPGVLKTELNKRLVFFDVGSTSEYIDAPVTIDLPQYEICIDLVDYSESRNISDKTGVVALRLVSAQEVSHNALPYGLELESRAHWATSSTSVGTFKGVCMGDYHDSLKKAAKQGLVPFLVEFVEFLQTCTDEHAYERKERWAAYLGKDEYNKVAFRLANPDETIENAQNKYREEYKKRAVNPLNLPDVTNNLGGQDSYTQDAFNYLTAHYFGAQGPIRTANRFSYFVEDEYNEDTEDDDF